MIERKEVKFETLILKKQFISLRRIMMITPIILAIFLLVAAGLIFYALRAGNMNGKEKEKAGKVTVGQKKKVYFVIPEYKGLLKDYTDALDNFVIRDVLPAIKTTADQKSARLQAHRFGVVAEIKRTPPHNADICVSFRIEKDTENNKVFLKIDFNEWKWGVASELDGTQELAVELPAVNREAIKKAGKIETLIGQFTTAVMGPPYSRFS